MARFRIATFNVENLLQRFDFYRYGQLTKEAPLEILGVTEFEENIRLRKSFHVALTDDSRQQTAQAIRDADADIVCMQEVDNADVLDDFHNMYLKKVPGLHYGWRRCLQGNDRRGIDVAVMGRKWLRVTSHKDHTFADFGLTDLAEAYGLGGGDRIFRRDCLEVETNLGDTGEDLFLFICHFKSMSGGREHTKPVREAEAKAVRKIIENKFGNDIDNKYWVICGDLNDYTHENGTADDGHALDALVDGNFAKNLLLDLNDPTEQWTHYWPGENSYRQLDYILASPAVQRDFNPTVELVRRGQPYRATRLGENIARYPRTGYDRPKASDHCPLVVTLNF